MAAGISPIFTSALHVSAVQFTSTDTTSEKTLLTAGTNGSRIDGILISTNDTTAVNLAFALNDGSTDHYIGVVAVPSGSGYTTVARVDGIGTLGAAGLGCLLVPAGWSLKCNCVATMTSGKTTDAVAVGGDY